MNFPKKAVNLRGPTLEQLSWDLAGGFYLRFEDLTITWRYVQVYKLDITLNDCFSL